MRRILKTIVVIFFIFVGLSILGGVYRMFGSEDNLVDGNIAVIEVEGVISDSMPVLEQLEKIRKNKNLKAIVVRINSPGGAVGASQEIYMELKRMKATHPVIVTMGDMAASGGLYVSLAGDHVIALPGTLTASMGVVLQMTSVSRLLEKIYVDPVTLKSGELKDAGNPTKPLDPKARQLLQDLIASTFSSFKSSVVEERKLSEEAAKILEDGRVVDGKQALELKLVDQLGTFQDAVNVAKDRAKITGEVKLAFLSRKPRGIVERALSEAMAPVHSWVKDRAAYLQYRFEPGVR